MRLASASPFLFGSVLSLSLLHCGSDSGSSGSSNLSSYLGVWTCDAKTTIKVTSPSGTPDQTETSNLTLTITKSSATTITAGDPESPACDMELVLGGGSASLKSPVECDMSGVMLKVTSAKVSVSGSKLTGSRTGSVSGQADNGDPLTGTATTTIDCTKESGPANTDGGSGSGGKSGTGGRTGTGATGTGATGTGATGSGGANAGSCASASSCSDCCASENPDGADTLDGLLTDCVCQQCATECASSLCSANPTAPTTGDACDACSSAALSDTGSCVKSAAAACKNDAGCTAFARCVAGCP